jgi:cytochrome P450
MSLAQETPLAEAPVVDWVNQESLVADPDAVADRLLEEAPIAFVPLFNGLIISRFDLVQKILTHNELHTVVGGDGGATVRAVGPSLIHEEGETHTVQRSQIMPSLRPKAVEQEWMKVFTDNAERALGRLIEAGPGANFDEAFSRPFAADNLSAVIGIPSLDFEDVIRWSGAMTAGSVNLFDIPEIWAASDIAQAESGAAIDEAIPYLKRNPNNSMLSMLINAEHTLPLEVIKANIRLAISGGVNEPQHTTTNGVWALSRNPDQLNRVKGDARAYMAAFDETVRMYPPIYLNAKRSRSEGYGLDGVAIPPDTNVIVFMLAANRDPAQFDDPTTFDVFRKKRPNLTFGAGVHACAGSFIAKAAIGGAAWPLLYRRLTGFRAIEPESIHQQGWVFRSLPELPVTWDSVVAD